jgi:hypothetical protein
MGEGRKLYKVLGGKPKGRRPLETPRHRWRMGIEWIVGRLAGGVWSGFTWVRIGTIGWLP